MSFSVSSTIDFLFSSSFWTKENKGKVLIQIHGMTSNCFKEREKIIAEKLQELNIDTICFNNRGSEIIRYAKKIDEIGYKLYEDKAHIVSGV